VPPAATFLMSYLVIVALFAALYKNLPDVKVKWSDVALGAMLVSLLFMIGKQLMGMYFSQSSLGSAYSAAGSPIVVLLWVYSSALLFFWGAEVSRSTRRPWIPERPVAQGRSTRSLPHFGPRSAPWTGGSQPTLRRSGASPPPAARSEPGRTR